MRDDLCYLSGTKNSNLYRYEKMNGRYEPDGELSEDIYQKIDQNLRQRPFADLVRKLLLHKGVIEP